MKTRNVTKAIALALSYDPTAVLTWSRAVFTVRGSEWFECGMARSGAKIQCRKWGKAIRWRLSGYAHDGSDVEVLKITCKCGDEFFATKLENSKQCKDCVEDSLPIYE